MPSSLVPEYSINITNNTPSTTFPLRSTDVYPPEAEDYKAPEDDLKPGESTALEWSMPKNCGGKMLGRVTFVTPEKSGEVAIFGVGIIKEDTFRGDDEPVFQQYSEMDTPDLTGEEWETFKRQDTADSFLVIGSSQVGYVVTVTPLPLAEGLGKSDNLGKTMKKAVDVSIDLA